MNQKLQTPKLHNRAGIFLTIICVLFSIFAFSFNASSTDGSVSLVYDVNSMLQFAIAALSIYLFRRLFLTSVFTPSAIEALIAALFAILSTTGMLLDSAGTLAVGSIAVSNMRVGNTFIICFVLILITIGFFLFYYASIDWLFAKISKLRERTIKNHRSPTFFKHELTLPICAGILLIAWLPYIIYFFPFTITTDASRHLAQILGNLELTTHFPYLPGLIESKLYQLGTMLEPSGALGMFLMGIIQILLGLLVFTEITIWLKRLNMPNWLVYGTLAFSALFPLVPIYMVQISKDTLHAELVALFILQLFLFCLNKRDNLAYGPKSFIYSPWAIAIIGLLVSLTRNNGIIIVVFALVVCLILYRDKLIAAASLALCVCFCIWQFTIIPACGIKSEGYAEACSMPAQVIASCIKDGAQLTEEEQNQLQSFFTTDLNTIADLYNPHISDPVKNDLSLRTLNDAMTFVSTAISFTIENPTTAISAALNTTYGTWYPFCKGSYHSEDVPYIVDIANDWANIEQWYASADQQPTVHANKQLGIQAIAAFHYIPVVSMFYTPGVYFWLIVLILGFSIKAKSNRALTATVLSTFFALWIIMLFGPCASLRYALPAVFSLPIFVAILTVNPNHNEKKPADKEVVQHEI